MFVCVLVSTVATSNSHFGQEGHLKRVRVRVRQAKRKKWEEAKINSGHLASVSSAPADGQTAYGKLGWQIDRTGSKHFFTLIFTLFHFNFPSLSFSLFSPLHSCCSHPDATQSNTSCIHTLTCFIEIAFHMNQSTYPRSEIIGMI